jgi:hypothetical protein
LHYETPHRYNEIFGLIFCRPHPFWLDTNGINTVDELRPRDLLFVVSLTSPLFDRLFST